MTRQREIMLEQRWLNGIQADLPGYRVRIAAMLRRNATTRREQGMAPRGGRMDRTAQILSVVAVASIVAGCTTGATHYTQASSGTVTFTGAVTGTGLAVSTASYPNRLPLPDGGTSDALGWIFLPVGDASPNEARCSFYLTSTTAPSMGVLTEADVSGLSCSVSAPGAAGSLEIWGGDWGTSYFEAPSTFEVTISSPGPETDDPPSGTFWKDPTATLTVYIAPGPGNPSQTEGVGFSVTVAPPPCPTYCAPGPP